jgi:hypothetical protein
MQRKRFVIYTCVISGYDRVYPPVKKSVDIDYVLFTDDPKLYVKGWDVRLIENFPHANSSLTNRYYKMLGYEVLSGYEASMYIDGNIRILKDMSGMFKEFMQGEALLGVFKHSRRKTVCDEINYCLEVGKFDKAFLAFSELKEYEEDGFTDDIPLIEATIILKKDQHPKLKSAMNLWYEKYSKFQSRDQFSLPYVIWRTDIKIKFFSFNFREENDFFGVYPHKREKSVRSAYSHIVARSYDSNMYFVILKLWHIYWSLRRLTSVLRLT